MQLSLNRRPFSALCALHAEFAARGDLTEVHQTVIDVTLTRAPEHRATFSEILGILEGEGELPPSDFASSAVPMVEEQRL